MQTLIFLLWILSGKVTPSEQHEGRQMYNLIVKDRTVEMMYKGEILNYIATDSIQFNEDFQD